MVIQKILKLNEKYNIVTGNIPVKREESVCRDILISMGMYQEEEKKDPYIVQYENCQSFILLSMRLLENSYVESNHSDYLDLVEMIIFMTQELKGGF